MKRSVESKLKNMEARSVQNPWASPYNSLFWRAELTQPDLKMVQFFQLLLVKFETSPLFDCTHLKLYQILKFNYILIFNNRDTLNDREIGEEQVDGSKCFQTQQHKLNLLAHHHCQTNEKD